MATSGIQEHNEGCRKQRVLDRAAYARKMYMEGHTFGQSGAQSPAYKPPEDPEAPGYMRRMGSPPGIPNQPYGQPAAPMRPVADLAGSHSPTAIDRLRRDNVRAQQLVTYSAKLPDRLSSVNFQQQW